MGMAAARRQTKRTLVLGIFAMVAALIGCGSVEPAEKLYEPAIVFRGYINNDWVELPGCFRKPNTAEMAGDTVRMYFYSEDYRDAKYPWSGDQMRVDIYPFNIDSVKYPGIPQALIRLSRYAGTNYTYIICPHDTLQAPPLALSFEVAMLNRRSEGSVHIKKIGANMHLVGNAGASMRLLNCEIIGVIQ